MATLYITQNGAQVCKSAERLVVRRGDQVLEEIPIIKIDRLVLMGKGVSITTPVLHTLAQRGIDVLFMTQSGRYVSRLQGQDHRHSKLRFLQAQAIANPEKAFATASAIVRGKIINQRVLVRRHAEGAGWAKNALLGMDTMQRRVETARNLDELRGLEGQAAKDYFGLVRKMLRPPSDGESWRFDQRAYYPPPDPINALLSFGYTLLLNDLVAACQLVGLDPGLGFFHVIDYGRPSMALDMEEEFRASIVDSIVLQAVNRPIIQLKDFEKAPITQQSDGSSSPSKGVFLTPAARSRFIALYEARTNELVQYPLTDEKTSYRRIFELQAQQMARFILGEAPNYLPVSIR